MTRLAASETSGRSRFERKLLLAEVCLATHRERLAKAVLEELAEQIDKHQLDSLGKLRTSQRRVDPAL